MPANPDDLSEVARSDTETAPPVSFPAAEADWAIIRASLRRRMLLPTLLLMTAATGVIDAFSYLAVGSVFTANMTGNVVLIGFALGGVPGFSIARTVISVVAFGFGSAAAGRLSRHWRRQPFIWLRRATAIEIGLLALAALASLGLATGVHTPDEVQRFLVIAFLAFAMGMRNATVRRLGFSDVPTTVLTSTITDFASDSRLGGGERRRQGRRAAAIVAMTVGALTGALLVRHVDPHAALLVAVALLLLAAAQQAVVARRHPNSSYRPDDPAEPQS